jgi:hypothetical protein
MRRLLILLSLFSNVANSAEVNISEQSVVRNMSSTRSYSALFMELKNNHIEFTMTVPEHRVRLHVDYYQQYDIATRDFTISVIEEATEMFFDWAEAKGFTFTNSRRDHRTLAVYDLDYNTLNDQNIIHFTSRARRGQSDSVNALYEAHRTPDNSNAILIGANRPASDMSRATTIAHELAHWWCDYFRIYDRYYIQEDGKADMESPAYDFQRYFAIRTTHRR